MDIAMEPRAGNNTDQGHRFVDAARLVVGSMASLMLRDKFKLEAQSPQDLLSETKLRYPDYFDWLDVGSEALNHGRLDRILSTLGLGVNYEGLDSTVVSEVYANAVVEESERFTTAS